jgi:SAM-dependent methyltransferase
MVDLGRESPSCLSCGSTVRLRAIVHLLSMELFGKSIALPEFPARPDLRGIGLSDWKRYARPLAGKLNYTNTYYHKPPRLDITVIEPDLEESLDFLIATDVFEHIAPPVSAGFQNVYRLLKPGGVFIFSVPYHNEGDETIEHFPELHQYEILKQNGRYILRNLTRDGKEQVFENLVFHGGDGATLEMRFFSKSSLLKEFAKAGFQQVKIYDEPDFDYGIYWHLDTSLPIVARK